jgi:ribosome recycling factor
MQEEIDFTIEAAQDSMERSLTHLNNELHKIRSGKASPDMLSSIKVDYYGSATPLAQVATLKTTDARTIVIQPWEKAMIRPIETAIMQANLGFNPQNDGILIRIIVPPLTEERRRQFIKLAQSYVEQAKVSIRNARREAIEDIKKAVKDGYPEDLGKRAEDDIQKLTDGYSAKTEKLMEAKEKDIMVI